MKKSIKKIIAILLTLITLLSAYTCIVSADEEISMLSLYFRNVESTAAVTSSGILEITNYYSTNSDDFTSAKISTYVERKTLGLFWVKVDNGQPNKTWVDNTKSTMYSKGYTLQLSKTGNYRVTIEYTFYGKNGSETVTRQPTATY